MRKKFLFICLSWLIALTANADNLTLYLTTDGLVADPNSSTPYATTDKSIEEGTVVTIHYSGIDNTTALSIYINGEVVSSGKIKRMTHSPYTFTAKKNCILRVEGAYAFNFSTNPNVYFTQDVDVTGVTLSQAEAAMTVGGDALTLTATVAPANATNKTVTWTSSDESVATVTNGVVTAVAAGTATITATATNGTADTSDDKTATCEVSVAASASSGPEVAWDKAKNTGTFTMPGGNVTLEPEYYPQAALTAAPTAINDVPATTDGAIVKAGTVANIGSTETAQGTVMYYVSPTALDDAALLALAADQWTADVPTAEKLAQGEAYVYYYVRGNDSDTDEENFSDGDILSANALTVTIAAEPTYAVTFKAANTNTIEAGKATVTVDDQPATVTEGKLQGVKMGTEVKVKAKEGYKFRKVEVKKGAPSLNITNPQVGQIIGSDGKNYAADTTLPSGVTAVAMIAYVGSETDDTDYTGGLAIALSDEGRMNWSTAKSTCEGKTAVTGAKWCLPSQNQWKAMFKANGGSESSYTGLNTAISTAGGTALQKSCYWSSTEHGEVNAYYVYLFSGNAYFSNASKGIDYLVRAVLAF